MNFLKSFIEDCKYYDLENTEVKTILKNINLKNKTLLDIGAGIGRLSFPLSRYTKEVIALEKDKRFKEYFKKHKKKNVRFINQNAEKFMKQKKFNIILLAWPSINFKFIALIKKSINKNSKIIFIIPDNNSDYEKIINKLDSKRSFEKEVNDKKIFLRKIEKEFKIIKKQKINTKYTYPNKKIAFRVIKNSMILWFDIKFNKNLENKLKTIVVQHKKDKRIIFGEEIWFYIMESLK